MSPGPTVLVVDALARDDAVRQALASACTVVAVPGHALPRPTDHTLGFSRPGTDAAAVREVQTALAVVGPDAVVLRSLAGVGIEIAEQLHADAVPYVVLIEDAWWLCEQRIMRRPAGWWCGQQGIDPLVCSTCVVDHRDHQRRQERSAAVLRGAARVVVPSVWWAEQLVGAGVPARALVQAEPDLGAVPPPAPWQGPVRFGFLGTDAADRVDHLIAAFADLRRTDFELITSSERDPRTGRLMLSRRDFPKAFLVRESGLAGAAYLDLLDVLVVPAEWPGASAAAAVSALAGGRHVLAAASGPVAGLLAARPDLAPWCTLVPPGPDGVRGGVEALLEAGVPAVGPAPVEGLGKWLTTAVAAVCDASR